jgi:hypothetical protein
MDEHDWLTGSDPEPMLRYLGERASDRKLRLFMCALSRRVWHLLTEELRRAVDVAERLADGKAGEAERAAAFEAAGGSMTEVFSQAVAIPAKALISSHLDFYAQHAAWSVTSVPDVEGRYILPTTDEQEDAEREAQCALLRELFGNPFRPAAIEPDWLSWEGGTVPRIARAIYDDRAFDLLPILADALEDAGCTDAVILDHCRGPGPHVRGCWVLDALLGMPPDRPKGPRAQWDPEADMPF